MEVKEIIRPGYKKTKLGWIPEDWKLMPIDIITDRITNRVEVEPNQKYREIGIRSHGKGLFHKKEVTGNSLGNKRVFWIEPDCFVVNIVFAWEQAVAKTTESEVGMIASHRFPMYKPKEGVLDLNYLLYFFKTPLGKHLLGLASPGGAGRNKTLGQKDFGKILIPIPSITEQRTIAQIMKTWEKAINITKSLIQSKKKQQKELMQTLLTGKIKSKIDANKWVEYRFEDVFSFVTSYAFSRANLSLDQNSKDVICNIHYGDIHAKLNGRFIDFDTHSIPTINETIKVKSPDHYLKDGDVIMADASEDYDGVGECMEVKNIRQIKALGGLHTFVIRDKGGVTLPAFRTYLFNNPRIKKMLKRVATGTSVYGISKRNLSKIMLPIPPLDEQEAIANILVNTDEELKILQKKIFDLKRQRKGLMQQLLIGKIQIKKLLS